MNPLDVFDQVVDLDESARRTRLVELCQGDEALIERVVALLEADSDDHAELHPDRVQRAVASSLAFIPEHEIPDRIGSFELVRMIGTGGMATVFEARQVNPDRRVALKVLAAPVTPTIRRRLQREAATMARCRHPSIVQVLEAGTNGPFAYIAMEYVEEGRSLPEFARRESLSLTDRVNLMAEVADAVHHIHTKSLVHRDIKPSNVLVDQSGKPRVLDFGIAQAIDATRTTDSARTLLYMSPEQLAHRDVDIRSDVYQLGVLTYLTLTGKHPHGVEDTSPPATVIDAVTRQVPRRMGTVDASFRGDIESIVGRAIHPDPGSRYGSAAALADDLRNYLAKRPIRARPVTLLYATRLFAQRSPLLSTLIVLAVVLVAGGLGVALWQQQLARKHERTATATVAVLERLIASLVPWNEHDRDTGPTVTQSVVVPMLTEVTTELESLLADEQLSLAVRSSVHTILANANMYAAKEPEAERHWRDALETRRQLYGEEDPRTLEALYRHGESLMWMADTIAWMGRPGFETWAVPAEAALSEYLSRIGPNTPDRDVAWALSSMVQLRIAQAHVRDDDSLLQDAERFVTDLRPLIPDDPHARLDFPSPEILESHLYGAAGRSDEAIGVLREYLDSLQPVPGDDHPRTYSVLSSLAYMTRTTDCENSLDYFSRAEQVGRRRYGRSQ